MMSPQAIHYEQRKAAQRAAREKKIPFIVWPEDLKEIRAGNLDPARGIPFIGNYIPKGWKKTENLYFVDSSGFGAPGEAALTFTQFADKMREGFGYAIVEAGQFQVYVQEYEPPKPKFR